MRSIFPRTSPRTSLQTSPLALPSPRNSPLTLPSPREGRGVLFGSAIDSGRRTSRLREDGLLSSRGGEGDVPPGSFGAVMREFFGEICPCEQPGNLSGSTADSGRTGRAGDALSSSGGEGWGEEAVFSHEAGSRNGGAVGPRARRRPPLP